MSLPKVVYVREDRDHNDERYLSVGETVLECLDGEDHATVGTYERVRTAKVRKTVSIEDAD